MVHTHPAANNSWAVASVQHSSSPCCSMRTPALYAADSKQHRDVDGKQTGTRQSSPTHHIPAQWGTHDQATCTTQWHPATSLPIWQQLLCPQTRAAAAGTACTLCAMANTHSQQPDTPPMLLLLPGPGRQRLPCGGRSLAVWRSSGACCVCCLWCCVWSTSQRPHARYLYIFLSLGSRSRNSRSMRFSMRFLMSMSVCVYVGGWGWRGCGEAGRHTDTCTASRLSACARAKVVDTDSTATHHPLAMLQAHSRPPQDPRQQTGLQTARPPQHTARGCCAGAAQATHQRAPSPPKCALAPGALARNLLRSCCVTSTTTLLWSSCLRAFMMRTMAASIWGLRSSSIC